MASVLPTAKPLQGPRQSTNGKPPPHLSHEASGVLRDQVLAELEALALADDLDAGGLAKGKHFEAGGGDRVRIAFQVRLAHTQPRARLCDFLPLRTVANGPQNLQKLVFLPPPAPLGS